MEQRFRRDYDGEFVILDTRLVNGVKQETREWIPNLIQNNHTSGRAAVIGPVHKGDRLVSSHLPGVAMVLQDQFYLPGCIIGKALEDYTSEGPAVIEIAVGIR